MQFFIYKDTRTILPSFIECNTRLHVKLIILQSFFINNFHGYCFNNILISMGFWNRHEKFSLCSQFTSQELIYNNGHIHYFINNEFLVPLVSVYVKTIDLYLEVNLTGLKIQEISEEKNYIIVHNPYGLPVLCYTSDLNFQVTQIKIFVLKTRYA